jgi:hypothetical protein
MKAESTNRSTLAHLSVVGSSKHLNPKITDWATWMTEKGGSGVLEHFNRPENWPGPDAMYGSTKLMMAYAFAEVSKMALGPDGRYA